MILSRQFQFNLPVINKVDTSKLEILYIHSHKSPLEEHPAFWAHYDDKLLYAVCYRYEFGNWESLFDWSTENDFFDFIKPTRKELKRLLQYDPVYYEFNLSSYLEDKLEFCQFEVDLILKWNRDEKIKQLLK